NVSNTNSANNIAAGNYSVTITDANSCTAMKTAIITEPTALSSSETHVNALCSGPPSGSITITVNGGTPNYSYSWNPNVSNTNIANNIPAGTYNVTITDANGCSILQSATVTQPGALSTTVATVDVLCNGLSTGSIVLTTNGGTPNYSFSWSPNVSNTDSANNIAAGNYS